MLDLLKWRAHPERISDSLSKLREIDGSEIVKVNSLLLLWLDSDGHKLDLCSVPPVSPGHPGHALWYFG